jgi:HSP20 family protein
MVNLIRWSSPSVMEPRPFVSPLGLLDEVEQIAREAFEDTLIHGLEMSEEEKELVVKADMPGMTKRHMNIQLEGDVLTIKAEKKTGSPAGKGRKSGRERTYEEYVRSITLPTRVEGDKITATLKKGRLEIRLPKAETPPAKQIEIKTK